MKKNLSFFTIAYVYVVPLLPIAPHRSCLLQMHCSKQQKSYNPGNHNYKAVKIIVVLLRCIHKQNNSNYRVLKTS